MEPLEIAINMGTESNVFYQKASEKSGDNLGKALFSRLAQEKDLHAARASEIHESLKQEIGSLLTEVSFDQGKRLESIFSQATKDIMPKREVASRQLEVIQVG